MPNIEKSIKRREIPDKDWLTQYAKILEQAHGQILELGSGRGSDTGYLSEHGAVTAVDINLKALQELKEKHPTATTLIADLGESWPLPDRTYSFILASLSLHYFSDAVTRQCVSELKRVIKPDGTALLRFNSTNDANYGAQSDDEIEPNYYLVNGQPKRFFSKDALEDYFADWHIEQLQEISIDRYLKNKVVWELVCRR